MFQFIKELHCEFAQILIKKVLAQNCHMPMFQDYIFNKILHENIAFWN